MARLTKEQELIVRKNFEEYMKIYGPLYPEGCKEFIIEHFLDESFEIDFYPDVLHQIYAHTGAYDFVKNFYDLCIDEIKDDYSIDGHIIDIGCGFYPGFAERLQKLQHDGSVTAMDYDLLTTEHGDIKLIKGKFTEFTNLAKYDLVLGIMPCEATIPMIKNANKSDKDLFIQMCGCTHFENPEMIYPITVGLWYEYVDHVLKSTIPDSRTYKFYQPDWAEYPIIKTMKK